MQEKHKLDKGKREIERGGKFVGKSFFLGLNNDF